MRKWCAALALAFLGCAVPAPALAQSKPDPRDIGAIRDCVENNGGESCISVVAKPCSERPESQSGHGEAECYDREQAAWDLLLNESFRKLAKNLEPQQREKLREMQRAWIASRDKTCELFWDFYQGTMAVPMQAACLNRETARRALFLLRFRISFDLLVEAGGIEPLEPSAKFRELVSAQFGNR
jgi:uncharacterized protein YecT (DUF1311 family)